MIVGSVRNATTATVLLLILVCSAFMTANSRTLSSERNEQKWNQLSNGNKDEMKVHSDVHDHESHLHTTRHLDYSETPGYNYGENPVPTPTLTTPTYDNYSGGEPGEPLGDGVGEGGETPETYGGEGKTYGGTVGYNYSQPSPPGGENSAPTPTLTTPTIDTYSEVESGKSYEPLAGEGETYGGEGKTLGGEGETPGEGKSYGGEGKSYGGEGETYGGEGETLGGEGETLGGEGETLGGEGETLGNETFSPSPATSDNDNDYYYDPDMNDEEDDGDLGGLGNDEPTKSPEKYYDEATSSPTTAPKKTASPSNQSSYPPSAPPTITPTSQPSVPLPTSTPTNYDVLRVIENNVKHEEDEIVTIVHNRTAEVMAVLLAVFGLAGMILTAHQLMEKPDGICSSICRLSIKLCSFSAKIIFLPCRLMCCNRHQGYTGSDPENTAVFKDAEEYTSDLEIT